MTGVPERDVTGRIVAPPQAPICAWCPDFDPKAPQQGGRSHGICRTCANRMIAEAAERHPVEEEDPTP